MSKSQNFYYQKSDSEYEQNIMKRVFFRTAASVLILTVFAVIISFFKLRLPFLPRMFSLDFSVFPEMIAALAFGPIYGIGICFVKSVIHMLFINNSLVVDVSNFLSDAVFLGITGGFYLMKMFPINPDFIPDNISSGNKHFRGKTIIKGSLLGIVASLPVKFLTTNYIVYPVLEKLYKSSGVTPQAIINSYNTSINSAKSFIPESIASHVPEVKTVWQGVLMINIPVSLAKLVAVVVLCLIIYPLVSPILHGRPMIDKKAN